MSDLLTALMILPWLIPLGLFTVIFFEWSARTRGEDNMSAWLLCQWEEHQGKGDSRPDGGGSGLPRQSSEDAIRQLLGEKRG